MMWDPRAAASGAPLWPFAVIGDYVLHYRCNAKTSLAVRGLLHSGDDWTVIGREKV